MPKLIVINSIKRLLFLANIITYSLCHLFVPYELQGNEIALEKLSSMVICWLSLTLLELLGVLPDSSMATLEAYLWCLSK